MATSCQIGCMELKICTAVAVALLAFAAGSTMAQMVAEAPGPALSSTASDAPLTQSSEAMCRAKLGGTSQTLIMVADPGDFTGTGTNQNQCWQSQISACMHSAHEQLLQQIRFYPNASYRSCYRNLRLQCGSKLLKNSMHQAG